METLKLFALTYNNQETKQQYHFTIGDRIKHGGRITEIIKDDEWVGGYFIKTKTGKMAIEYVFPEPIPEDDLIKSVLTAFDDAQINGRTVIISYDNFNNIQTILQKILGDGYKRIHW